MNNSRVAVFIDNSNVFQSLQRLSTLNSSYWIKRYNPKILAQKLCGNRKLIKVYFYCSPPPEDLKSRDIIKYQKQSSYYFKVSQLEDVEVRYGTLTKNDGKYFEKNLDTQLVADMIMLAVSDMYDTAIVVANDGDFVSAVESVKSLNKRVEVAYFKLKASMNLRKSAHVTRRLRPSHFKSI